VIRLSWKVTSKHCADDSRVLFDLSVPLLREDALWALVITSWKTVGLNFLCVGKTYGFRGRIWYLLQLKLCCIPLKSVEGLRMLLFADVVLLQIYRSIKSGGSLDINLFDYVVTHWKSKNVSCRKCKSQTSTEDASLFRTYESSLR
jgi:hypothetical protein